MCLKINEGQGAKIAEQDIVVYKRLVSERVCPKLDDGQIVTIVDRDGTHTEACVSVECRGTYFCTNNVRWDGASCKDNKGYKYSWIFDEDVVDILVNGKSVTIKQNYKTPYREAKVSIGKTYTSRISASSKSVHEALHSFSSIEDCYKDNRGKCIVAECIIPKGSEYYEGTFGTMKSYASDKLTYVKIVS